MTKVKNSNMKQKTHNIVLYVLALTALTISLIKIEPFSIGEGTYIGIIVTLLSLSTAMIIGYQIYNSIELKKELIEQRKINEKLAYDNIEMEKTMKEQSYAMQEGFDIISAIMSYQEHNQQLSIDAFMGIHHALLSSLKTKREDYEWIFSLMKKYIDEISILNFCTGTVEKDGKLYSTDFGEHTEKLVEDIINEKYNIIDEDEKIIRESSNFRIIKRDYNDMMLHYRKRINEILRGK